MYRHPPRKLGQRSFRLLQEIRATNAELKRKDGFGLIGDPVPIKESYRVKPTAPIISDEAIDILLDKEEAA